MLPVKLKRLHITPISWRSFVFTMVNFLCENLCDLQKKITEEKRAEELLRAKNQTLHRKKKERSRNEQNLDVRKEKPLKVESLAAHIEEEAESVSRRAMVKEALGIGKSGNEARKVALQARKDCLQHHGCEGSIIDEENGTNNAPLKRHDHNEKENISNVLEENESSGFMESLK